MAELALVGQHPSNDNQHNLDPANAARDQEEEVESDSALTDKAEHRSSSATGDWLSLTQ